MIVAFDRGLCFLFCLEPGHLHFVPKGRPGDFSDVSPLSDISSLLLPSPAAISVLSFYGLILNFVKGRLLRLALVLYSSGKIIINS